MVYLGVGVRNLNLEFFQMSYHFIKSYSCYTCLVEMLNESVGVLSFMLEMSKYSINNDWVVESQLKFSQSYFMLFILNFSNKKNQLIYSDSVNETDSVDQVDSFKKYHPLV